MNDLFLLPTFKVGESIAIAYLENQEFRRKPAKIAAVNDLGILVRDDDGYEQWFDLDNRRRCPGCGQVCGYLEKQDAP